MKLRGEENRVCLHNNVTSSCYVRCQRGAREKSRGVDFFFTGKERIVRTMRENDVLFKSLMVLVLFCKVKQLPAEGVTVPNYIHFPFGGPFVGVRMKLKESRKQL